MEFIKFISGEGETTQIGFKNNNNQVNHGMLKVKGTDHVQYAYRMECLECGYIYGANGSDISLRKCPECMGGQPGIRYWKKDSIKIGRK